MTNVKNIDYRKAAIYTSVGVIAGGIVIIGVYHGVKYVVKKRKAKKSKEDFTAEANQRKG